MAPRRPTGQTPARRGLSCGARRRPGPTERGDLPDLDQCPAPCATTPSSSVRASPASSCCTGCASSASRVRVIEAGADVGGTWYWNRYPGARCDVESLVYSYSWCEELQQEWHWSERYAPQPEILRVPPARRRPVRPAPRHPVRDPRHGRRLRRGDQPLDGDDRRGEQLDAAFLIMATGCLSVPRAPDVDGLERFAGDVYQTALWPHEPVDFTGLARRRPRHGVVRRAGDPGDRRAGGAPDRLPAHAGVQRAELERPARSRPSSATSRRTTTSGARLARETGGGNPWHERPISVFDATPEERRRRSSRRATASAASSCTRRTTTCSPTRTRTSSSPTSSAARSASGSPTRPGRGAVPVRVPAGDEADVHRRRATTRRSTGPTSAS